ncbi:GvpL/GvpF family gas vesicle protein [Pseudonocardia sp. CA-107938]|uniref:GvpL/GvpF family gas vesicle protein n=1 Tax=Pseudonocardia sp. CA-107938 TaxID=3240021 RepID=UPI003D8DE61C
MKGGELTYLYAVAPASVAPPDLLGVDGEEPRTVVEGAVAAVVGSVAAARFDESAVARDLTDLGRIEQLARAHHAVVAAVEQPVAPVRLATIYRDDDGVRRLLRDRGPELAELLERLGTCREWGVKVWVAAEPEEPVAAGNGRPGTAYLQRRMAVRDAGVRRRAEAAEVADRTHAALARVAVAEHRMAPQDAALSGRREEMVLNATYLVRRSDEDAFAAVVAGAATCGIEVVRTGPWPPFSFATVDLT